VVASAINGFLWRELTFGTSPLFPSVCFMDIASNLLLPTNGVMPVQYLIIPAAVGAAVVGSFERRISRWMSNNRKSTKEPSNDQGKNE